ncbi:DUF6493 family protein [Lacibacter sediminis]|uniref:D-tyrosyl-tRNA(Tyr) deacylase n=1 Tax=Lacibacter sediminis TaxID=2760713 RepID=A0A7G5XFM0_9BACT|nr:DUF6493 family protein [Lacibacter sediminis]QNA44273.1 hypothetical protein H4075_19755 [Lacibacter sediminis]
MLQQFKEILAKSKSDVLIPFLQHLSNEDKRNIAAGLKAISKEYLDYYEDKTITGSYNYKQKANEKQRDILLITAFVCYNKKEFTKTGYPSAILDEKYLTQILGWYCPDWFSEFVNDLAKLDFVAYTLNYRLVMNLSTKGLLQPSKELVAKILPQFIFNRDSNRAIYQPENVLIYPETLATHIWYLFEVESGIHYSDRWLHYGSDVTKTETGWVPLLKTYCNEGRIERKRLLQETIYATNRNFNKQLSGWFCELLFALEPLPEEVLELQAPFMTVLSSPHSKAVNTSLQFFKKIVVHKDFDNRSFIDNTPVLLASDTRNVLINTIALLEKIIKKEKELQEQVCESLLHVFIRNDEDIQRRAAKIIKTCSAQLATSYYSQLASYKGSMLQSAVSVLHEIPAFHEQSVNDTIETAIENQYNYTEEVKASVTVVETIDDLVFFASQAFDNHEPWHIDMLPASLLQMNRLLNGSNINKLEPALQRALKTVGNSYSPLQGNLDQILATFFIDVCIYYTRKYPGETKILQQLFEKFDQKDGNEIKRWTAIDPKTSYLESWENYFKDPFYKPHKLLLLLALQKIKSNDSLPLLSTITHAPCHIEPLTLVNKLVLYQQAGKYPDSIDFQVAISRCNLANTTAAIEAAEAKLQGELKHIALFLFGKEKEPQPPFNSQVVWMCSSLALANKLTYPAFSSFAYYKYPFAIFTGQFPWQSVQEEYKNQRYDYQKQKSVEYIDSRKLLKIHIEKKTQKAATGLSKFVSSIFGQTKQAAEEEPLLFDFFKIRSQWLSIENDIQRILYLIPNNTEPFLAELINHCLSHPTFFSETDKRIVANSIRCVYELWGRFNETGYLFLGTCMLASDKTVLNIAGETWIKAVAKNEINNQLLGSIIGKHERIEFAPLKRFTDLVDQQLTGISNQHNRSLIQLIEYILTELPDEGIKNLKRLLQIYHELLLKEAATVTHPIVIEKMSCWHKIASLKKLTESIQNISAI